MECNGIGETSSLHCGGSYSGDPRSVKKAEMLESLSYSEAAEMAWFGAKVGDQFE